MINLKIIQFFVICYYWSLINGDDNLMVSSVQSLVSDKYNNQLNTLNKQYKLNHLISEYELKLLEESYQVITNENCKNDLNSTILGIVNRLPWAIAMYDASAKSSSGIETGSVYQFGHFDECAEINENRQLQQHHRHIQSKYCLADIRTDQYQRRNSGSRQNQPQHSDSNSNSNTTLIIHWGVCVPATCELDDIEMFLTNLLMRQVHLDNDKCYVNKPFEATKGMIVYGCIILCFVLMTLASTLFHVTLLMAQQKPSKYNSPEYFIMIIKSFSLIENLQKLFQKSHDNLGLNSINGIKAILMMLIISGHSLLFVSGGPVLNSGFLSIEVTKLQNAFLLNSVLFVDTFLLLSGFLFCRILLKELNKRNGKINIFILYIFRYIRLTPAYLAVIGFYLTWFPAIGSGPLWRHRIELEQKRCEKSWWLNLLYINNYFGTDNLCMFQSWYLSADTQLFILAPIFIYLLWRNRKVGLLFLISLGILTSILPSLLTYLEKLDPTLLIIEDEIQDISSNPFFLNSYIKTHMRATGYVFGLMTGFLLHYITEKGIKIPKKLVVIFWLLSTVIGVLSMFSVTFFYINKSFTTTESSIYAGLHRLGWCLSTGWLIIASTTGNCGIFNKILCSRFFAPLSRLTYCAYLTNGLVELYMAGSIRAPIYMDHINLLGVTVSHAGFTFITSIILCLLFESPIHGIEKILLRRENNRQQQQQHHHQDGSGIHRSSSAGSTSEDIA